MTDVYASMKLWELRQREYALVSLALQTSGRKQRRYQRELDVVRTYIRSYGQTCQLTLFDNYTIM